MSHKSEAAATRVRLPEGLGLVPLTHKSKAAKEMDVFHPSPLLFLHNLGPKLRVLGTKLGVLGREVTCHLTVQVMTNRSHLKEAWLNSRDMHVGRRTGGFLKAGPK